MNRADLEHILRAASRIAETDEVLVFGSQAVLGSFTEAELPAAATLSTEADITFFDDEDNTRSDRVDLNIGEDSLFHGSFGYYAQGINVETATLPDGWRERLVVLESAATVPGRGLCLEPHDLVVSKLVAGREKDLTFASAMIGAGLVDLEVLHSRAESLPVIAGVRRRIHDWIDQLGSHQA